MEDQAHSLKNNPKNDPPTVHDTYRLAYALHFFLGAGTLLPWNALITAVDYFGSLYPDHHVVKVFSVAYMGSSLLVLIVMLWSGCCRRISTLRLRMNVGFSLLFVSLMTTPMMQWFWHDHGEKMRSVKGYGVVVGSVVVCGLGDGLIGGSLIGTAGMLPEKYMQAVFAGTASSGILISILRIITKASLPHTPQGLKNSAQFYFIVTSSVLIGCIICCNLLHHLPVMRHHRANLHNILPPYNSGSSPYALRHVLAKIKFPAFGVFMIYTVTLSIFPGFLAENVESNLLKDWYPIALIAAYNVADFIGKSLTVLYVVQGIKKAAWGCMARLVFYPLFVVCLRGPVAWLRTEVPMVVLTVMLGFSNGYLTSAVMILAPKEVVEPQAEVAAIVMAVMLATGLVAGSVISWIWII